MADDGKKVRIDADTLKELQILKAELGMRSVSDLIDFIMTRANLYQESKLDGSFDCYGIFKQKDMK